MISITDGTPGYFENTSACVLPVFARDSVAVADHSSRPPRPSDSPLAAVMTKNFLVALLFLLSSALEAQEGSSVSPSREGSDAPPYHLFNAVSQDSVIEKLNQYGAIGYRFLAEARAEGGAYTVIMEKFPRGTYQYVYASGTLHKSKFQENLNANGARGFRFLNGTMGGAPPGGGMFSEPLLFALMEKTSSPEDTYEYKVVAPMLLQSFAKDLGDAASLGFQPVEADSMAELSQLRGPGDRYLVIVERRSKKPAQTGAIARSYRLVGISELKDREFKTVEKVAQGYRILFTGYGRSGLHSESAFFALLERPPDAADAIHSIAEKPAVREYRFLDAEQEGLESRQAGAFVRQLSDAAARGYEPADKPISRIFIINRWGKPHFKFTAVLQKSDRKLEYQLAYADDTPGLSRRLVELWEKGFRVPPMGLLSNQSAIVERELTSTQTKAP